MQAPACIRNSYEKEPILKSFLDLLFFNACCVLTKLGLRFEGLRRCKWSGSRFFLRHNGCENKATILRVHRSGKGERDSRDSLKLPQTSGSERRNAFLSPAQKRRKLLFNLEILVIRKSANKIWSGGRNE